MEREADVLQQRVEAVALDRGHWQPLERVRAEKQEGVETERDEPLRGERRLHRALGQPALDQRDQRARGRHHRDPQQHRALVVAPRARQLEDHRLHRVRVHRHQLHRKVGAREQPDEHRERERAHHALDDRRGSHEQCKFARLIVLARGKETRDQLQGSERGGEPQRGETELCNHFPVVSSTTSFFCAAVMSSSSRGT